MGTNVFLPSVAGNLTVDGVLFGSKYFFCFFLLQMLVLSCKSTACKENHSSKELARVWLEVPRWGFQYRGLGLQFQSWCGHEHCCAVTWFVTLLCCPTVWELFLWVPSEAAPELFSQAVQQCAKGREGFQGLRGACVAVWFGVRMRNSNSLLLLSF